MIINVTIKNKQAFLPVPAVIVCGNKDYKINFSFDEEWEERKSKTARFFYNGTYEEVIFTGNICDVPVLSNITGVFIGVFSGDIYTTTPAYIPCDKSILCLGGAHAEPPKDVYNQIIELINELQLEKGKPSNELPLMDGEASAGSNIQYSRADHTHPTDTTRASAKDLTEEVTRAKEAEKTNADNLTNHIKNYDDKVKALEEAESALDKKITDEISRQDEDISNATKTANEAKTTADTLDNTIQSALSLNEETRRLLDVEEERAEKEEERIEGRLDTHINDTYTPKMTVLDGAITELKNSKQDNLVFADKYDAETNRVATVQTVTDKIAEVVANAPDSLDTLKELSDWLVEHGSEAAEMNSAIKKNAKDISTNAQNIAVNTADIETLKTDAEENNELAQKAFDNSTATLDTASRAKALSEQTAQNLASSVDEFLRLIGILDNADKKIEGKIDTHINDTYTPKMRELDANDASHTKAIESLTQNKQDNIAIADGYDATNNKVATVQTVANKIAEIIAGAPEDFNTLKELADWLDTHGKEAAEMNSAIVELQRIKENKGEITTTDGKAMRLFVDTIEAFENLEDKSNVIAFFTNDPHIAMLNTMAEGIEANATEISNAVKQKEYSNAQYTPSFDDGDCARAYVRNRDNTEGSILVSKYTKAHSIALRDSAGNLFTLTPTDKNHCANKQYVDDEVTKIKDGTTVAGKARYDASGNLITSTYATKSQLTSAMQSIANGNTVVGKATNDANGNNIANTYAKATTVNSILDGTTPIGKADSASELSTSISDVSLTNGQATHRLTLYKAYIISIPIAGIGSETMIMQVNAQNGNSHSSISASGYKCSYNDYSGLLKITTPTSGTAPTWVSIREI